MTGSSSVREGKGATEYPGDRVGEKLTQQALALGEWTAGTADQEAEDGIAVRQSTVGAGEMAQCTYSLPHMHRDLSLGPLPQRPCKGVAAHVCNLRAPM